MITSSSVLSVMPLQYLFDVNDNSITLVHLSTTSKSCNYWEIHVRRVAGIVQILSVNVIVPCVAPKLCSKLCRVYSISMPNLFVTLGRSLFRILITSLMKSPYLSAALYRRQVQSIVSSTAAIRPFTSINCRKVYSQKVTL